MIFSLLSCDELPCISKQKIQLGLEFYYYDSLKMDTKRPIAFNKVKVRNENGDLSLDSNLTLLGLKSPTDNIKLDIPLRSKSITLFLLDTNTKDSIHFNLIPNVFFISEECGYNYYYNISGIESFGGRRFKRSEIVNNQIDTAAKNHVKIFY